MSYLLEYTFPRKNSILACGSKKKRMKIAVIILNYNGKSDTLACLESLQTVVGDGYTTETIVVDNASSDDSVARIREQFPEVTLLTNQQNLGFSEGNNVGIRHAFKTQADYILLLNNDTTVDGYFFREILEAEKTIGKSVVMGPKIYFSPGREFHKDRYKTEEQGNVIWYAGGKIDWDNVIASHRGVDEVDRGQYNELGKTQFVSGCALFAPRVIFETVGLFDMKLYLYYEDVDFCKRAQKKGYDLYYVPAAKLWHKNAASSGGSGSELQVYYQTRNRLLIGMRYAPWKTKLALMREATLLLMSGTPTQRYAVGDFLRKKYGPRDTGTFKMPDFRRYLPGNTKKNP